MKRHPSLIPLSHQHQHGLAMTVLIDRGLRDQPSIEKAKELCRQVLDLADIELKGHFQVEEQIVFPAAREALDSAHIVDELIGQHRRLEGLTARLREAGDHDLIPLLKELGKLLERHIRLEERQLFEQMQSHLTEEQINALGRQIDENLRRVCPVTGKLPWEHQ